MKTRTCAKWAVWVQQCNRSEKTLGDPAYDRRCQSGCFPIPSAARRRVAATGVVVWMNRIAVRAHDRFRPPHEPSVVNQIPICPVRSAGVAVL